MDRQRATRVEIRTELGRLRWIGVGIPVAAVVVAETFRALIPDTPNDTAMHVLWGGIAVSAITLFALIMFWWIGQAEREIVRQNRELGAVNAVSRAVQDEESSHAAILAALRSLVDATRASRAVIRVYPPEGEPPLDPIVCEGPQPGSRDAPVLPVELPLTTGSAVVGLLEVWLTERSPEEAISAAALQNISHQLGCAIQLRRLVDDLQRRQREAAALYDVALLIGDQQALADTLAHIMRTVRELLGMDEVAICLTPEASAVVSAARSVAADAGRPIPKANDGAICVTLGEEGLRPAHDSGGICAVRSSPEFRHVHEVPIRGGDAAFGDIWVARRADRPIDAADRTVVAGLAELASIAITSARLRERERLSATVAERERIARELHDSLAQVLGVTHLRLRSIASSPVVQGAAEVAGEIEDLAELAQDAFRDVREAILGLREASRLERGFVPSLSAYLDKFSRQSGIAVSLDARVERDPDLAPGSEIQVIRVIQEALANVRKHAGAASAVVRLFDDPLCTTIEVEDDGRGFDVARMLDEREGYGLQTMRERIELVGGELVIDSNPGHGTRVTVRIPRERPNPQEDGGTRAAEAIAPGAAGR
jgi:signal transduction histidine kinase